MSESRFDVTFIRGPRDHSSWRDGSRQIRMALASPQGEKDALAARASFYEQSHEKKWYTNVEHFPNASYELKGRRK